MPPLQLLEIRREECLATWCTFTLDVFLWCFQVSLHSDDQISRNLSNQLQMEVEIIFRGFHTFCENFIVRTLRNSEGRYLMMCLSDIPSLVHDLPTDFKLLWLKVGHLTQFLPKIENFAGKSTDYVILSVEIDCFGFCERKWHLWDTWTLWHMPWPQGIHVHRVLCHGERVCPKP